ncbi:MAG TPA: DUF4446 family protein [Candidatus Paceibacterota bacterium]|nr:DUF4446 family protein [Candidatus Paceibacterota bacterium]
MLGSIPLIYVLAVAILFGVVIVLAIASIRNDHKLKSFMRGKDGASLEATLAWLTQKAATLDDTLHAHKEALEMIDRRVKRSIRGYSLIRYNAYENAGGDQSFASGLIDEHGDGYILSVITNRNHVGVYAKRVNRGTPEVSLTEEEKEALALAQKSLI